MQVKLARINPPRHLSLAPVPWPAYKTSGAAGMDLCADVDETGVTIPPGGWASVPTGLKMEIPDGYEGQIRPRSGLAFRAGVTLINAPGTVDADFRGEVMIGLVNHGAYPFRLHRGDRIAQLVICPVLAVDVVHVPESELSSTVRGANGLGSTGLNDSGAKR